MIREYSSIDNPDSDIFVIIRKSNWGKNNNQWGIQIDVKVTPIYCQNCQTQLPVIYKMDGGRYGAVGKILCNCGSEIHCIDSDNFVDYLLLATKVNNVTKNYRIEYNYLYKLTNENFLQIKNKVNFDVYQLENEKWISLSSIIDQIIKSSKITFEISDHSSGKFSKLPFIVNKWLSLLDEVNKMPLLIPPKVIKSKNFLLSFFKSKTLENKNYDYVNFENLNFFLNDYSSQNECGHTLKELQLKSLSNIYGFRKIGDLIDNEIGTLSYLTVNLNKVKLTGCYPLHDCEIYMCDKCNQVFFTHINDGGIAPRPEVFLADYKQMYLNEPAVKSVYINEILINVFYNEFNLIGAEKVTSDEYCQLKLNKIPTSPIIVDY